MGYTGKRKHGVRVKKLAFRYWRENDHNCKEVHDLLLGKGYRISHATITRWANDEDWEAQEALVDNQLARLMKESDDPVLRTLVLDDIEFAKTLGIMYRVVRQVMGGKGKQRIVPRNSKELLDWIKFIRDGQNELMGKIEQAPPVYNDNRKLNVKMMMGKLGKEDAFEVMDQIRGVKKLPAPLDLDAVRKQING